MKRPSAATIDITLGNVFTSATGNTKFAMIGGRYRPVSDELDRVMQLLAALRVYTETGGVETLVNKVEQIYKPIQ